VLVSLFLFLANRPNVVTMTHLKSTYTKWTWMNWHAGTLTRMSVCMKLRGKTHSVIFHIQQILLFSVLHMFHHYGGWRCIAVFGLRIQEQTWKYFQMPNMICWVLCSEY
jgi:hypothetical protein